MAEKRIARICWNEHGWVRPSGSTNKSKNSKTYENLAGFGWEEWLLDTTKLIDGYHYGFIQAVNYHWGKYEGNKFDISLFSFNGQDKSKWWIGEIKNVEVISPSLSDEIYEEYVARGWITEMRNDLLDVGADVTKFVHKNPDYCFVLRYRLEDLNILDKPLKFDDDDKTLKAFYTNSLYYYRKKPKLDDKESKGIVFKSKKNIDKKSKIEYVSKQTIQIVDLFHNRMQIAIYQILAEKFGADRVGMEISVGAGFRIDLVVKGDSKFIFYELKTGNSLRLNIREALAQLLDYSYYSKSERTVEMIIVSHLPVTEDARRYLQYLRDNFSVILYYQQIDMERQILSEKI